MNRPKREWDDIDAEAEREAQHVKGFHDRRRMRYRRGLENNISDLEWERLVNQAG